MVLPLKEHKKNNIPHCMVIAQLLRIWDQ